MTIFDVLNLIGGLFLFLFGMNVMGDGLERRAGNSLKALLGKLTGSRIMGFLTGLGVTAVIQSSSATTVIVVGFAVAHSAFNILCTGSRKRIPTLQSTTGYCR